MEVDLSILLVNWNATGYLQNCLASIAQCVQGIRYEVIVVDNSRTDHCEAMLREHFPGARLVTPDRNLGFARANNRGCQQATGRNILFLNPDTEIRGDALQTMVGWLDAHSEVGAVGARLLNSDGSFQTSSAQAFPTILNQMLDAEMIRRWFPRLRIWGTRDLAATPGEAVPVDAISGACFMVRREAFEAAGRFSENYFMYADDLDLSYKLHRAGYSVVCLTGCEVVHHGGRSSVQRSRSFADVAQRTSMIEFLRATRGPAYSCAYRATTFLTACLRIVIVLFAVLFTRGEQRDRLHTAMHRWSRILLWSVGAGHPSELL